MPCEAVEPFTRGYAHGSEASRSGGRGAEQREVPRPSGSHLAHGPNGTSGENSALGLANLELVSKLGATVPDIQLANMVYSLIAGALMVAGGLLGTVIGWKRNFRMGALLCALGEIVMAFSPNMTVLIWGGRVLVGLGASFMIPSVLGLVPKIYHGKNRVQAYGCIGAASGLAAVLP